MASSWHSCVEYRTKSFADGDNGDGSDDEDEDGGPIILARMPAAAMQAAWYLVRTRTSGVVNDATDEERFCCWTIVDWIGTLLALN